jgi:hypothetical protein
MRSQLVVVPWGCAVSWSWSHGDALSAGRGPMGMRCQLVMVPWGCAVSLSWSHGDALSAGRGPIRMRCQLVVVPWGCVSAGRGPMAAPVSAAFVPPKTAIKKTHSEPTVGLGHSVSSTLLPGSSDGGFVTVARKRRVELRGSSTNSSKKLRPAMIGVRSSTSLSCSEKSENYVTFCLASLY